MKNTILASACALLFATLGFPGSAAAQPQSGITVFNDVNFGGGSQTFQGDMPDLTQIGLNDTISSIQVAPGEVWQVCQDVNYQGRCRNVSGTISDLRNMNFNDQISSMRRVSGGNGRFGRFGRNGNNNQGVVLYTDANFGGRSVVINNDVPNFQSMGINDQVSSIQIPAGETWEVCVDANYSNRCTTLTGSVADMRSMGMNDRISSIRRVSNGYNNTSRYNNYGYDNNGYSNNNNGYGGLVFYDRPYFRGGSMTLSRNTNNANLMAWEGSLRVSGGVWRLCDTSGNCATVDRDVPDISYLGLNDRITTVQELNTSQYRRWR